MTGDAIRRGRVGEFETLVLENETVRAVIVPSLGGRIWELEDLARDREWIWHREGVPLRAVSPGAVYDEVWAGGWEELFPNDAPAAFEGRCLPDHGEWWTAAWTVVDASSRTARLSTTMSTVRAACIKEVRLSKDSADLCVCYRIRSLETRPFHFLFKQHLPIRITPACRLVLPGGVVHAVDQSFGTMLSGPGPFEWPPATDGVGGAADMRIVPPATPGLREFVYVSNIPESWCGVDDQAKSASIRMTFEPEAFPYVWLFLSYGGWRDTYTAVLEPCTNMPKNLEEAVRLGQSAVLRPGEEFVTTVTVSFGDYLEVRR